MLELWRIQQLRRWVSASANKPRTRRSRTPRFWLFLWFVLPHQQHQLFRQISMREIPQQSTSAPQQHPSFILLFFNCYYLSCWMRKSSCKYPKMMRYKNRWQILNLRSIHHHSYVNKRYIIYSSFAQLPQQTQSKNYIVSLYQFKSLNSKKIRLKKHAEKHFKAARVSAVPGMMRLLWFKFI